MVNKTSLVSLSVFFFFSIWWITDDMLLIGVVQKYFRLGLKYLIPLKKINLLYINYCTSCVHSLLQNLHSLVHSKYE